MAVGVRAAGGLARAVESAIEMVAGAPSVVLAIFGLLVFSRGFLGFLSQGAAQGAVGGQSFLNAGIVMSLLALPLVVGSTREALAQLPDRMREASYALGKTRATTIRSVLLPSIRPSIASGSCSAWADHRRHRDRHDPARRDAEQRTRRRRPAARDAARRRLDADQLHLQHSPAGEGNSHEKAYAAAFVLLLIVLAINALVTRLASAGRTQRSARRGSAAAGLRELRWIR